MTTERVVELEDVEDDDVCWMCGLPSDSSDSYSNDVCDCYEDDEE